MCIMYFYNSVIHLVILLSILLYPLSGPTWSMQHQSGTHTWQKISKHSEVCMYDDQKLGQRLQWASVYDKLIPPLADRRLYLKLCSLYKIVHNLTLYFAPNIVVPKVTRLYTSTPFTFYQPLAHTVFCTSCCIPLELTSRASCFKSLFRNF